MSDNMNKLVFYAMLGSMFRECFLSGMNEHTQNVTK